MGYGEVKNGKAETTGREITGIKGPALEDGWATARTACWACGWCGAPAPRRWSCCVRGTLPDSASGPVDHVGTILCVFDILIGWGKMLSWQASSSLRNWSPNPCRSPSRWPRVSRTSSCNAGMDVQAVRYYALPLRARCIDSSRVWALVVPLTMSRYRPSGSATSSSGQAFPSPNI